MTRKQAVELGNTGFWKEMTQRERATFQLFEPRLCMPFDVFHHAMEETLGRPVFTHEFAYPDSLKAELLGEKKAPTFEEIMDLIPVDKRLIVVAP